MYTLITMIDHHIRTEKERDCGKDRQAESEILSNGGIMRGMLYIFYKMHGLSVVPRNRNKF